MAEKEEFRISKNNYKFYINALLQLENLFNNYSKKSKSDDSIVFKDFGYLIDKKSFDVIKEKLFYNEFKIYINDPIKFDLKMEEKYKNIKYLSFIPFEQKIFHTLQELENNIKKDNEYIIINKLVWTIMNNGRYKEDKGKIIYEISNNNLIIFNDNGEKLYFKFNFNLINKKNILSRELINNLTQICNDETNNKEKIKKNHFIRNFDNYINLLLNIYLNDKSINNKMNKKLEKGLRFEIIYIVNKNYIEELKKYFNYEEFQRNKIIEIFFKQIDEIDKFYELMKNNNFRDELKNSLLETKFFVSISIDKKKIKEIKNDEELIDVEKIYLNNKEYYYYKNFEIITNDFFQILNNENLSLKEENMIKTKALFFENKIFFYPFLLKMDNLILANYDNNHEFKSEFIYGFNNSDLLKQYINELKNNPKENKFENIIFHNNEANIFLQSTKEKIGIIYKIIDKKSLLKLSPIIEEEIYNIIKLYLFNLDLYNYLSLSTEQVSTVNYDKYIHVEKCYLINKEWMIQYRNYYLYAELYNYLENQEIKEKLGIHHLNKKN